MSHYGEDYFKWQHRLGILAGKGNLFLYEKHIQPQDNVLDFGCGGAFLLSNITCKGKLGIEINPEARKLAATNQVEAKANVADVPDGWADVIISCHALEHTHRPLDELRSLYPKLKQGGKIIFVVPYEKKFKYKSGDINQHLYTWSAMAMGNLFTTAGYKVHSVEEIYHRFPPYSPKLINILGKKLFHLAARFYGLLRYNMTQIKVVAEKA